MILLAVFVIFFAYGFWRAKRAGGGLPDKVRYGVIFGLIATLVVYAVATLGDWYGLI